MNHWKFCLGDSDYAWSSGIPVDQHYRFYDERGILRLHISNEGTITVTKGYAWDGCSPKYRFLDLCYLGTPDGVMSKKTLRPKAYYASLVHDALYQFMDHPDMPYNRKQMDLFFRQQLQDDHFWWCHIYYLAVRLLGGPYHWLRRTLKIA